MKILTKTKVNKGSNLRDITSSWPPDGFCPLCNLPEEDCKCEKLKCKCSLLAVNCKWPLCICNDCLEIICECKENE